MNTKKANTNFRLIAICLVTFSLFGTSCTSLQQSASIATDDLYTTPNNTNNTIASNKKVISAENWGMPNKVQNYNSNQQNNSTSQNNSNNSEGVNADSEEYQDYQNYQDDRYLKLKVANRNRWSTIDDWGYWNDPRFNNAFYPSYMGWNSWYTGYYGASWYYPFGSSFSLGWGGYNPYSSFGYGMGWGFNDFGYGGFGYNGFGFGGFGYGGFGYGGFGYGGWNPYYAGYWNPYANYYQYGGMFGGNPINIRNYDKFVPVQSNRTNLNPYMKNMGQFRRVADVRENGSFVNSNNNTGARSNTPSSFRNSNSNSATNSNANSNITQPNSSSFSSLIKRVMNVNSNERAASFNNSSKNYSNQNNSNQSNTPIRSSSSPSFSAPASSGSGSGGSSGGGGFIGGGRRPGGGK